jgi:hypothetical protein
LGEYFWGRDPFLFGLYYYVYSRGRREFEEGASGIRRRVGTAWVYGIDRRGDRGGGIVFLYGYGFKSSGFIYSKWDSVDG